MTTPKEKSALGHWLTNASREQRAALAQLAGTWLQGLYKVARGAHSPSAAKAASIEAASIEMHAAYPELPALRRAELCAACAVCPHALAAARARQ